MIINRCSSLKDQKKLYYTSGNELLITSYVASHMSLISRIHEENLHTINQILFNDQIGQKTG